MDCGYCGRPVPDGLRFCPACGAPVGQKPQDQQTLSQTSVRPATPGGQQRVQYLSPDETRSRPPKGPNRTLFWIGVAAAAVLVIVLAVLIPILVTGGGDDSGLTTTTAGVTTTLAVTTTTLAVTTTTAVAGPVGDSAGSWVEVSVPGGPWKATEVAISEEVLLIVTSSGSVNKLSAMMLGSGQVIQLSQSQAISGLDVEGRLAVWWEASGWDAATQTYAHQYIKSCLLPTGTKNVVSESTTSRLGLPQVALPLVTWVISEPWADNPDEYMNQRIVGNRVNDRGAPIGAADPLVPSALALTLGDSGWQYSLSGTRVAWENSVDNAGFGPGTHVMKTDGSGHQALGAEAWRPSLWGDLLLYQDGSLKVRDLGTGDTRTIDPSGDFATAGPSFAAYYKPGTAGSLLVVRGYGGAHEQTLGELNQPPYFCPAISVSATHIAYAFEEQIRVFAWQAQ
jgi:hypothetical protein